MLVSSVDSYNMLQEVVCATIDFHAKNHSIKKFYQRWSSDLVHSNTHAMYISTLCLFSDCQRDKVNTFLPLCL